MSTALAGAAAFASGFVIVALWITAVLIAQRPRRRPPRWLR